MIVLLFKINNNDYAIDIAYVHEIIQRQRITPISSQKVYIAGVTDVRGKVYTCVDLSGVLFNKRGEWSKNQLFLLTSCNNNLISFIVDMADGVVNIDESEVMVSNMAFTNNTALEGIFRHNNSLVGLLDVQAAYDLITGA